MYHGCRFCERNGKVSNIYQGNSSNESGIKAEEGGHMDVHVT